jgi:DNA alkylation repair enzyme
VRWLLEDVDDRWAADSDFWLRRSAMLALLISLREGRGDFDRFGRYADAMLCEREFFIRKAIAGYCATRDEGAPTSYTSGCCRGRHGRRP